MREGGDAVGERLTCSGCRFWDRRQNADLGLCRRRAPLPGLPRTSGLDAERALWPLTVADDFCGEWQPPSVVQRKEPVP